MQLITITFDEGTKVVQQAGIIKRGRIYRLKGNTIYKGKLILVDWISTHANIVVGDERYHMVSGTLCNAGIHTNKKINTSTIDIELQDAEVQRQRVRAAAAKLLQAGKKEQALKLLKTLK